MVLTTWGLSLPTSGFRAHAFHMAPVVIVRKSQLMIPIWDLLIACVQSQPRAEVSTNSSGGSAQRVEKQSIYTQKPSSLRAESGGQSSGGDTSAGGSAPGAEVKDRDKRERERYKEKRPQDIAQSRSQLDLANLSKASTVCSEEGQNSSHSGSWEAFKK